MTSFILDCEIVAFDREKNKLLSFQVTQYRIAKALLMFKYGCSLQIFSCFLFFFFFCLQKLSTRAHKNVNIDDIKVGVCIFGFDMLYLNGQLLIQENLNTRREVRHQFKS